MATYLHYGEGNVTLAPAGEAAAAARPANATANSTAAATNSTAPAYLGCLAGSQSLVDGDVVGVVGGVASPLDCCRLCRERGNATCNAWNFCAQREGCR